MLDGAEFQIGASIGIALGPGDGACAEDLLKHADTAMYAAKRAGRDAYALYSAGAEDSRGKLTLTARLRRALAEDEFVLHYQPIHDLATGQLRGLEALIRWEDPNLGLVPPDAFIPHAEETGLITRIGAWVIEETCRQTRGVGRSSGSGRGSAGTRRRASCATRATSTASPTRSRATGSTRRRCSSRCASRAIHDVDRTLDVIDRLHRLGVKLALDDFGTEHSSLSRLRALPVQVLKVDRSFLRDLPGDAPSAAIVRAIATLGAGLGMDVVAEGIETAEQLAFAAEAGCGFGQGYHFARPLPAARGRRRCSHRLWRRRRRAAPATAR